MHRSVVMKSLIYARVSSKEQEEEGFSVPSQLKLLREYAKKNCFEIVEEFVDVETAKQAGRTAFGNMVHFLKESPSVKTLLVEKTDRLYRNFRDYVTVDDLDVEIHLVKEGEVLSKDSKSHQKFIHGIKVLMAKNYIDNLSEEVKKGHLEKAQQGQLPSLAPIGYRNNTQDHTIEVHEQEAEAVRRLFKLYATGNYSLKQLREVAIEAGVVGRRSGRHLTKSEVARILNNPIYYGKFLWGGKLYRGTHTPIITKELFDASQQALSVRHKSQKHKWDFAFRGLLTCSRCGCSITAEAHKGHVYYRCTYARGKCEQGYVREEVIDRQMADLAKAVEIDQKRLEWVKRGLKESHEDEQAYHDAQIQGLHARYEQLQRRLDQIYLDKLDGKIAEEFWREKHETWRKEQEETRAALQRHERANTSYYEEGVGILELAQQAYSLYVGASQQNKRDIVRSLLSNCTLNNATLCPTYRKPYQLLRDALQMKETGEQRDLNPRPPGPQSDRHAAISIGTREHCGRSSVTLVAGEVRRR